MASVYDDLKSEAKSAGEGIKARGENISAYSKAYGKSEAPVPKTEGLGKTLNVDKVDRRYKAPTKSRRKYAGK